MGEYTLPHIVMQARSRAAKGEIILRMGSFVMYLWKIQYTGVKFSSKHWHGIIIRAIVLYNISSVIHHAACFSTNHRSILKEFSIHWEKNIPSQ